MLPRPERVAPTGIPAWVGTEETAGTLLVADLYLRPGGAVLGEHIHPAIEERFTVRRGRVGFRLNGHEDIAIPGRQLLAPAGVTARSSRKLSHVSEQAAVGQSGSRAVDAFA
jgi:uncharacterized cupin superfamily protein